MSRPSRVSLSHLVPHLALMPRENVLSECKRVILFGVQQDQLSHQRVVSLLRMLKQAEGERDPVAFQGIITNMAMSLEGFETVQPPTEPVKHDAASIISFLPFERYSLSLSANAIIARPSPVGKIVPIILEKIAQVRTKVEIGIEVRVSIPCHPTGTDARVMWITSQDASFQTETGYQVISLEEVRKWVQ